MWDAIIAPTHPYTHTPIKSNALVFVRNNLARIIQNTAKSFASTQNEKRTLPTQPSRNMTGNPGREQH